MRLVRQVGLHPFLASAYPVLTLLAANAGQVRYSIVLRPLVLSLLGAAVLVGVLRWWLKDWIKAGMLATWLIVLFFGYGHLYNALRGVVLAGTTLGRHRFLVPAWALLALGGGWLIAQHRIDVRAGSRALNAVLVIALVFPLGQLAWPRNAGAAVLSGQELATQIRAQGMDLDSMPDIYYIILDAYARADTLSESFDLDNSAFLEALGGLGFYVADCSQANYAQTELTLAAALNMDYVDRLVEQPLSEPDDRRRLWPLMRQSMVRTGLEQSGYLSVAFETGYYWSEWEDADLYLAPPTGWLAGMTAYEGTLLRSTAAWAAIDALPVLPPGLLRDLDRSTAAHRERVEFVLDQLAGMATRPGPKLVFVHLVSPHRPFVFDSQGNPVEDDYTWTPSNLGLERYKSGYREQVRFLNNRLLPILERLIADSDPAPVILLQSDHGPEEGAAVDRIRNLGAYFLGAVGQETLLPGITPVNGFRAVFRSRFGLELPLLQDVSYFSTYDRPFEFTIIDESCPAEG